MASLSYGSLPDSLADRRRPSRLAMRGQAREGTAGSGSLAPRSDARRPDASLPPVVDRSLRPLDLPPPQWVAPTGRTLDARSPGTLASSRSLSTRFPADAAVGVSGLNNLGNTCFLNAVVQALSATIPLARFLNDGAFRSSLALGSSGTFARTFARLTSVLWRGDHAAVSPLSLRDALFARAPLLAEAGEQQDAQEALGALLDGLHADLKAPARSASLKLNGLSEAQLAWADYMRSDCSPIVDLFAGQERSVLTCDRGHLSTRHTPIWCVSLKLPRKAKSLTLIDLLDAYVKPERLDDLVTCDACGKRRKTTKTLSLSRVPPVLAVHLSRVGADARGLPVKHDAPVAFPVHGFDLGRWNRRAGLYDLYAVVEHTGSAGFGHYTACVRTGRDAWSDVSDDVVRPASLNDKRSTASILFYHALA